jgi:hypothetical chaperone protein
MPLGYTFVMQSAAPSKLVYGIDFGTSNSLLAAGEAGKTHKAIPLDTDPENRGDATILRSILYFPHMKQCFFGARAIREFAQHDMEGRLIRSIKKFLPVRSFVGTWVEERPLNLEDIIAIFLAEMRKRANEHFGQDVDQAVIGRPARFADDDADDAYAQYRLEKAAKAAGFKHVEFFAEPIAAAYGFRGLLGETQKTVLVADFGGGTSDFTVIRLGRDSHKDSDLLSIGGISVAGDALDGTMMRHKISPHFGADVSYKVPFGSNVLKMPTDLMSKLCSPADISLLRKRDTLEFFRNVRTWSLGAEDRDKMDRLFCLLENQLGFPVFEEIERTKRRLSEGSETIYNFAYPDIEIREPVTRREFESFAGEKVQAILETLDRTVKDAGLTAEGIDIVCCTGGTAKVPAIYEGLVARFGKVKVQHHNHHHSVVEGLAYRARELSET